jgi:streptogramin lyase
VIGLLAVPGVAFAELSSTPAVPTTAATGATSTAHLVEWDLPFEADMSPGAVTIDTRGRDHNRLWFVTRTSIDGQPRVYRFDPPQSLLRGNARFTSWSLVEPLFSGGVRRLTVSPDQRSLLVRTSSFVERVDTQKCAPGTPAAPRLCAGALTIWEFPEDTSSPGPFVSDVAVDDQNRTFTTGFTGAFPGYVQMIPPIATPAAPPAFTDTFVTRWIIPGGLSLCAPTGPSAPCASGIDIHPVKRNLVYFSDPGGNAIGELNITNSAVRRWELTSLGVIEPRQLSIDRWGKVWVVTASGHVVSLDPVWSRLMKHEMPENVANDPFGVAPDDDVIGYTGALSNKVGMLFPKGQAVYIAPICNTAIRNDIVPAVVISGASTVITDTTAGTPKIVTAKTTTKADGTFVEAIINTNSNDSFSPLGITPNKSKAQGTFFYTVGLKAPFDPNSGASVVPFANRVGFARLPIKEKIKNPRDDDDSDDGLDRNTHPGWHNSEPDDEDADGVGDRYDTPTTRENMTMADPASIAAGAALEYPLAASGTTLALIASVTADSPTATIAVDVYNALGALVATSGPMAGAGIATVPTPPAGTYKVRVRNLSLAPIVHTPTFIVREPAIP